MSSDMKDTELREQLAAIEHERWADWQKWMHKVLRDTHDPSPEYGDILERWDRQIETPYAELSEAEKQSDRDQVDRYWPLIQALIKRETDKAVDEVLDELIEWSEAFVPPITKPFNWYGAVKALKVAKDHRKPFNVLKQQQGEGK